MSGRNTHERDAAHRGVFPATLVSWSDSMSVEAALRALEAHLIDLEGRDVSARHFGLWSLNATVRAFGMGIFFINAEKASVPALPTIVTLGEFQLGVNGLGG